MPDYVEGENPEKLPLRRGTDVTWAARISRFYAIR
jgi:hypothetical protein